jgi:hydroxyethylthiazole kinase-like uncharacterized protein yjeF
VSAAPAPLTPRPGLPLDAHKGTAGRVLVLAGSTWMPGAALLSVRAAMRGGAGLVTLACRDPELARIAPASVPEAVLVPVDEGFPALRDDHARLAGPGLGADERTRELTERMLDDSREVPLVLDADALGVFAGEPERLAARGGALVITPHPGEASRLLGREVPADEPGRVEAALELSRRSGAVACLKGRGTVVASAQSGHVHVCEHGTPALATAGSGDVLAGLMVACAADARLRGAEDWTLFAAAAWAVTVHALAGELVEAERGVRGAVASDLVDALPTAERELARRVGGPRG